jgi:hypothetical protein
MPSVDHASTLDRPFDLDADDSAPQARARRFSEIWVLGLLLGLVGFVWDISRRGLFKVGDDVGYWLGVGGPLLVLLHCGFRAGSLNAAAALYSMVIVASSGVIGRFLYVRVNRGLVVEHRSLQQLRLALGLDGR